MTGSGDRRYGWWLGILVVIAMLGLSVSPALAQPTDVAAMSDEQPNYLQSGANSEFTVVRTAPDRVNVSLNALLVGGEVPRGNVTITTTGESDWKRTWNLNNSTPTNGVYETTVQPPAASDEPNGSLVNATVTLSEANVTDTAHLHSAALSGMPVWTNNGNVYVPLNETVGITQGDPVTLAFGDETFDAGLDTGRNLFVVAAENVSAENQTITPTVGLRTEGTPISGETTLRPEIRYLHGDMVLWHPYLRNGTAYEITVHHINGTAINTTESRTASRDGVVPVPNSTEMRGAATANISLDSEAVTFGPREITGISRTPTAVGTMVDTQNVSLSHDSEPLAVSSILVNGTGTNNTETTYLSTASFEAENRTLKLSGANITENATLRLTTDAGIVELRLLQEDGTQGTERGGLMQVALFVAGGLALGGVSGVSGLFAGAKLNIQDVVQELLLLVMVVLVFLLLFMLGWSFIDGFQSYWQTVAGGVAILLVAGTGGYAIGKLKYGSSVGTSATSTRKVTVSVTDGETKIPGTTKITAKRERDGETVTTTITDGLGRIKLQPGTWNVQAIHAGQTSESKPVGDLYGNNSVTLEIDLPDVQVQLEDPVQNKPIPDASVRMDAAGETEAKRTGTSGAETGVVTFEPPADADTVTITADHDRYHETVEEYRLTTDGVQDTIELQQQSGTAKLVSQIDGVPAGEMDLTLAPDDQYLKHLYGDSTDITTDASGSTDADVLIGQYRATIDLSDHPDSLFETDTATFTIMAGRDTDVTLDATFTWDLSRAQRDRIREIRDDLDGLTAKSGIDTAIPKYYASVIHTVLDAVEGFPDDGHHFAEIDTHPDDIVAATLDGAEEMTSLISDAMSTKRNRDLFSACSDMAQTDVRWNGQFDFDTLADRLNEDSTDLRRTFAQRVDDVSDRIDTERGTLSEIAPARDMLDTVDIPDAGEQADRIVRTHIALLVLDAIDELFDHPELKDRLSRTVF